MSPVRAQNGRLSEQLLASDLGELASDVVTEGDARRGAVLFHQSHVQCRECHAVGDQSSTLGPDLTHWPSKDGPPKPAELVRSILNPSQRIREGYQTTIVLREDGQQLVGIVQHQDDNILTIRDASGSGAATQVPTAEIEDLTKSKQSIMPAGLVDQLANRREFLDLAKYVIEIAQQGPDRARELRPASSLLNQPALPEYESHVDHAGIIADWDRAALRRGQKIYQRVCANCHGTLDQEGSLPTSPRFATGILKQGSAPHQMYQTLTHGTGLMVAQRWMVPQQKYDVIHYIRETFFRPHNKELYTTVDAPYLAALPKGDTRGPEPQPLDQHIAMDYGPSMNQTFEIALNNSGEQIGHDLGRGARANDPWLNPDHYFTAGTAPNYAYKGIAVRLDSGAGGVTRGKHWMVYDHDTLNVQAGWSGDQFIDYHCIQFDGKHAVHNRLRGEIQFSNSVGPGWAQPATGQFADPRPLGRDGRPYGPLPRSWAKYQGLYHYGDRTILAYRVGDAQVLEHPSVAEGTSAPIFVRQLNISPVAHRLSLRVAADDRFVRVLGNDRAKLRREDGYWVMGLPRNAESTQIRVLISSHEIADGDAQRLQQAGKPNLQAWTKGGPARWPERVRTEIRTEHDDVFAVDRLTLPSDNPWHAQVRPTGLDFFADQRRAAVCTWDGDVWIVSGIDQSQGQLSWQRIATGLFQPLGLKIVADQVFVTCRDQLVRLRDLNGDRETDYYECYNNDHQVTEHFHEFAMGLQTDDQGNFYYAKSARHAKRAVVPHHGTLLKISADGKQTDIVATGFRAANGVCLNPDGTFFVTDQEGHWNPKNRINWVSPGGFYGNMYGYTDVLDPSDSAMQQPLCWITNRFDRSPAELLWVPKNTWGPLGGNLLNLSYGYGKIFIVPHERIGQQLQGGMCQLPIPDFPSGLVRGRFHRQRGDLYVCGMFSWAGSRQAPGCFHRVRYTGKAAHLPLQLQARQGQVRLQFSHSLDAESVAELDNYKIEVWDLKRTGNYGSKHYRQRTLAVTGASLSDDGKWVKLDVPDLEPTWGMSIEYQLRGNMGRSFQGLIHNSIYQLPPAENQAARR